MSRWIRAYIAFGSNLGDRKASLEAALNALHVHSDIRLESVSTFLQTQPVGPVPQGPYLNGAAELCTRLSARELLEQFLAIEASQGRMRDGEVRWGPRTLDLDLLFYGDNAECVLDEPGLTLPHPRVQDRRFVLEPLAEIAPDLIHPVLRLSVNDMLRRVVVMESEKALR